jgi:hypothetical protein
MRWLYGFLVSTAIACGPTGPIRAPEGGDSTSGGPRSEGRDRVLVRRLLVAFAGAEGVRDDVHRTREAALERATMLAGMARDSDGSFRELTNEYGDVPPDTDDRNRARVVERGSEDWPENVRIEALRLDVGQVSRPIETPSGFVILQRQEEESSTARPGPERIGARHILLSWRGSRNTNEAVTRSQEEALALARQIASMARDGAHDWNELHAEHSDEPDSPEGGDLGTFGRGEMVPAFERAAWALEVDEISDPVESPFGYHIIQRTR